MKRIFILNDKVSGGGAESVMRDLVSCLCDKYDITVMTLDDDYASFQNRFPPEVTYLPSKLINNPYRRLNPLYYVVCIYNFFRKILIWSKSYDVVISNKEGPCMQLVSKMRASRKLAWIHVDYRLLYWTHWTFSAEEEVKCMQGFDHVICVSHAAAEGVKMVVGDPGNLCVRYNPINYQSIMKNAEEPVALAREKSNPVFAAVGRITAQKNLLTLARVCARLSREFEFEVWIVGDGEQRCELERVLSQERCQCVHILGMQSNPHKYLAKADCLISASLGESYGLVVQEALILGVPVLATRCPAIEECFDERFGLLVDCNEGALEKGWRYLLENPGRLAEFRKNITEAYKPELLWECRLREIEELIS